MFLKLLAPTFFDSVLKYLSVVVELVFAIGVFGKNLLDEDEP